MRRKYIDVVRVDGDPLRVVGAALLADASVLGLQLDVPREGETPRFSRRRWPELGTFDAIVSRWHDDAAAEDSASALRALPGVEVVWSFAVTEHVGIERERDWSDGSPTPGLKHVSLLCGTVPTEEFRVAYRHHVELVREHLPLMWRYVQNDIDDAHAVRGDEFAAVSELSYRSAVDYERRWKYGVAGETEFRSHEGFLDLPRTVTMLCTEHVLRSS